jgi:hypothetical protein
VAKTGLTDRGIQKSMIRLKDLGELKIFRNTGPHGCNRYKVVMTTSEPGSPPNQVHPEPGSPLPEQGSPPPPNVVHHPPEPRSPGTVLEPSVEPSENKGRARKRATDRGTHIPDDFIVTATMVAWAREKCPDVNGRLATETFVSHWRASSGPNAIKRNWEQAWRTWLLKDQANATRYRRDRASPLALVERNGMRLKPETAARIDDDQRWAAADAARAPQHRPAIEGTAS